MKKISIEKLVEKAIIFYRIASMSYQTALEIMGLSPDWTEDQLKQKFKSMAYELHPDRNKSPDAHDKFIQLRTAYDILKAGKVPESELEPESTNEEPLDLSYEEIAEKRREMGKEEFDKKFPGWEQELQREMGLDAWNEVFEGYDPNYDPSSDEDSNRLWEAINDHAKDRAYDLFSQLEENNQLGHYFDSESNIIEKYIDITQDTWIMQLAKQKPHSGIIELYEKLLKEAFQDIKEKHIDDFDFSIEDVLSYPTYNIIRSFLIKNINKVEMPDKLLSEKEFGRVVATMLYYNELDIVLPVLDQYGHNKHFLDSLFNSFAYLRGIKSPEIKEIVKSLPFNSKQKEVINKILL